MKGGRRKTTRTREEMHGTGRKKQDRKQRSNKGGKNNTAGEIEKTCKEREVKGAKGGKGAMGYVSRGDE